MHTFFLRRELCHWCQVGRRSWVCCHVNEGQLHQQFHAFPVPALLADVLVDRYYILGKNQKRSKGSQQKWLLVLVGLLVEFGCWAPWSWEERKGSRVLGRDSWCKCRGNKQKQRVWISLSFCFSFSVVWISMPFILCFLNFEAMSKLQTQFIQPPNCFFFGYVCVIGGGNFRCLSECVF